VRLRWGRQCEHPDKECFREGLESAHDFDYAASFRHSTSDRRCSYTHHGQIAELETILLHIRLPPLFARTCTQLCSSLCCLRLNFSVLVLHFFLTLQMTHSRISFLALCGAAWFSPWTPGSALRTGIFLGASITDFLDGYLARKMASLFWILSHRPSGMVI
jgi:hypothetical protein